MHRVGFHFEKHIHKQIDRQTDKNRQEGKSQEHTYQNIQCLLCGRNFNCIFFQSVLSFNSLQWQWITCIRKYWKRQMVTYGLHWWCQKILTPPSDKKSNSEILLFYKNTCTLYQLLFQPSSPISYTLNCIWSNLTITKRAIKSHQLLCFHRNGNSHLLNTPKRFAGAVRRRGRAAAQLPPLLRPRGGRDIKQLQVEKCRDGERLTDTAGMSNLDSGNHRGPKPLASGSWPGLGASIPGRVEDRCGGSVSTEYGVFGRLRKEAERHVTSGPEHGLQAQRPQCESELCHEWALGPWAWTWPPCASVSASV